MAVTEFIVEATTLLADGHAWGDAGAYERLDGTAHFRVDPANPVNAVIVNLDRAPRDDQGMVAFTAPFRIVKPVDIARGNRKIWYGVNNRGVSLELGLRSYPQAASTADVATLEQVGENNILLREGYAVVDAGWHGDGIPAPQLLFPDFPVATNPDGSPITGKMRVELSATLPDPGLSGISLPLNYTELGAWRVYEAADTDTANATLTMRANASAPRQEIPADRWAFGRCDGGPESFVATTTDITLFDGFERHAIYELVYTAKNPIVMGLGYAVTRDVAAFLRYRTHDDAGRPNPLATGEGETGITRAYASGTSSTGMYLRDYLYLGFNEDEAQRRVFDGVTIYSAGAHRLFANTQFAHPTFFSDQDWHQDFVASAVQPCTFAVTTDPVTGLRDGILKRPATDPLVFQIDEELLFWQWKTSLNVVDGAGQPVDLPSNVRLYHLNGHGHIGASGLAAPPRPAGEFRHAMSNFTDSMAFVPRALTLAIDAWADRGEEPPASNYPRLEDGGLVSPEEYRAQFPKIPDMTPPEVMSEMDVLDFGPGFGPTGGVQTILPPKSGARYRLFLPRPGPDGAGIAGIDTIWTRVPLGTNVGWNLRTGTRAGDLGFLNGAYLPFARTEQERRSSGDSRPSLEARYGDQPGFVAAVAKGVAGLVAERFLLPEDASALRAAAEASDIFSGGNEAVATESGVVGLSATDT